MKNKQTNIETDARKWKMHAKTATKKIAHTEIKFITCILIPSVLQILQIVFKHFLASNGRHLKYFSETNRFVNDASGVYASVF